MYASHTLTLSYPQLLVWKQIYHLFIQSQSLAEFGKSRAYFTIEKHMISHVALQVDECIRWSKCWAVVMLYCTLSGEGPDIGWTWWSWKSFPNWMFLRFCLNEGESVECLSKIMYKGKQAEDRPACSCRYEQKNRKKKQPKEHTWRWKTQLRGRPLQAHCQKTLPYMDGRSWT